MSGVTAPGPTEDQEDQAVGAPGVLATVVVQEVSRRAVGTVEEAMETWRLSRSTSPAKE